MDQKIELNKLVSQRYNWTFRCACTIKKYANKRQRRDIEAQLGGQETNFNSKEENGSPHGFEVLKEEEERLAVEEKKVRDCHEERHDPQSGAEANQAVPNRSHFP